LTVIREVDRSNRKTLNLTEQQVGASVVWLNARTWKNRRKNTAFSGNALDAEFGIVSVHDMVHYGKSKPGSSSIPGAS